MSETTGITLNNNHLLRAAMVFVVVGIIGPGLFQLKPPQWLGSDEQVMVEVLAPLPEGEALLMPSQDENDALAAAPSPSVADQPTANADAVPVATASPATPSAEKAPVKAVEKTLVKAPAKSPVKPITKAKIVNPAPDVPELGGPNSADVGTQLAALKALPVPEKPAVRARIVPPTPKPEPKVAQRTARAPAVPKAAPVPVIVSREFTRRIPDSHVGLPVKQQKDNFIAITLPLILAANEEISQRRSAVRRAAKTNDRPALERWAKLYRVATDGVSIAEIETKVLVRADYVPVSLALAQAAIESGWGTSRFARQGNALFGQWAWQASAGLKPAEASNSRAVVRSFPNLFGSVRAYMHNLNTHPSYANFRERRSMLRGRKRADLGFQLANFMDSYAEIGTAYVDKLQMLIRSNDFGRFETARLR